MNKLSQEFFCCITMLKALLKAPRKYYKFPKVLINVLVIFHLLHSTPKSLLCPAPAQGRLSLHRSWPRLPNWVLDMEDPSRDLKREERSESFPSLPACLLPACCLKATAPLGPPPQCQLSALVISGELRASCCCYSLGASPIPCLFPNLYNLFICTTKDEISFLAGTLCDAANNPKSGYSKTVHCLKKSNLKV